MKKMPCISVVIPAYNAGKYIEKCIQSIISQDFKDMEIIIINDGSTDNTKEICEKYVDGVIEVIKAEGLTEWFVFVAEIM